MGKSCQAVPLTQWYTQSCSSAFYLRLFSSNIFKHAAALQLRHDGLLRQRCDAATFSA